MRTVFDEITRDELIHRINLLDENCEAIWGKMNINQMLRHCIQWDEVVLGKRSVKRSLLSRLFGRIVLKGFVKDDSPLRRYLPAVKELKVEKSIHTDIRSEKNKWISTMNEYSQVANHTFVLPFIGKVKKEHAGYVAYKHADHHLRQFGV